MDGDPKLPPRPDSAAVGVANADAPDERDVGADRERGTAARARGALVGAIELLGLALDAEGARTPVSVGAWINSVPATAPYAGFAGASLLVAFATQFCHAVVVERASGGNVPGTFRRAGIRTPLRTVLARAVGGRVGSRVQDPDNWNLARLLRIGDMRLNEKSGSYYTDECASIHYVIA